jgi:hypothetical protein
MDINEAVSKGVASFYSPSFLTPNRGGLYKSSHFGKSPLEDLGVRNNYQMIFLSDYLNNFIFAETIL